MPGVLIRRYRAADRSVRENCMLNSRFNIATLISIATILLSSCSEPPPPAPPPPQVDIIVVTPQSVANIVELPGRVAAIRTAEVRARVDGIVERRLFAEGSDVRAGQPLFRIDPRERRADYQAAAATLQRNQAAAANAAQVVARYRPLVNEQAISKQEFEAAIAQQRSSQADVANARAGADRARLALGYTNVTAPISGRVGRADVTEGALVSAGSATLMTKIEQIDPVYVNFGQSSSDVIALRRDIASGKINSPGLGSVRVSLVLEDGTEYGPEGILDFADLAIDQATGTVSLRARFPNPGLVLLSGQFVRARIDTGTVAGGIMVPQRAVKVTDRGATVMIVDSKNMAQVRQIELGQLNGKNWIVLGGLKAGDRVIVNGLQKVKPGAPVSVSPAKRGVPAAPATRGVTGTPR
jgi:membrane fusion protein, multidrug efflux system